MIQRMAPSARQRAIEQAIDWRVRLQDAPNDATEQAAFNRWLAADRQHAQAWGQVQDHLQQTLGPLAGPPGNAMRQALQSPDTSRRRLLHGALMLAGVGLGARLLSQPGLPLAELTADIKTGTAERHRSTLDDGSQLLLNAQSAVDIDFSAHTRELTLRSGKLLIEGHPDPRPLLVHTPFGSVRTSAARFMVALYPQAAHVWVLDASVDINNLGGSPRPLSHGQGVSIGQTLQPLAANRRAETAWQHGTLEADDWSLGEVIDNLRAYRRGFLQVSKAAAALPVSGVLSLDDSDHALRSLAQTLPIRVNHYLGFWTRIDLA